LIVRALYRLKSSGAAWHAHLASSILDVGFSSSLADPDVWLRAANHMDGRTYYEYLLVFVDDIVIISERDTTTDEGVIWILAKGHWRTNKLFRS